MIIKTTCFLVVSTLLLACSADDTGGLPPERPAGTISGQAVAAAISNAQVTVYGFVNGVRGTRLGGTVTDDDGAYAINIRAPSQAILVEISGGDYVEEASGTSVALTEGQVLRAVGRYQSGRPLTLMVTPLTHMAAALAEFKLSNGMAAAQAIAEAETAVSEFFSLDVQTVRPATITSANATTVDLSAGLPVDSLYSFYLAGLSHWTLWAGLENGESQPHATWNSLALGQILYQDLRADGLLDGRGDDPAVALGFGTLALDADVYRRIFSLYMLAFSQSTRNQSGINIQDLLEAAQVMAEQTALVPDETTPVAIDTQAPVLALYQLKDDETLLRPEEFAGKPQSGSFVLQVNVGGLLGATISNTSVVGPGDVEIINEDSHLTGSGRILLIVDTTDYADGEYTFTVTAEDILGKRTTESFRVPFDNTAPTVTITSPTSTNQATAMISGTFSDNIAGVAAITVAGQDATLFTNGTWQITVDLVAEINQFPIEVTDRIGNRRSDVTTTVYLDNTLPLIDSMNRHGQARLSNGDGTASDLAPLLDSNGALYFETNSVDLAGVLIDRTALDNSDIPYFAFDVSDDTAQDTPTAADAIQVQIQYRRNDQVLSPWHSLASVGGEYLIPLTSETLATDWHRTTPTEQHIIDIEVTDPAGNQSHAQFDFHADFYVPAFEISNDNGDDNNYIDDLGGNIFATTAFTDRASLNGMSFTSTAYTFRNTTGKAFYISLSDDSLHTTAQTVEQLVREHRVHVKATPEWRIGLMTPTDQCPDFDPNNDTWQYPTSIWNWNGSDWIEEQVPGSSDGTEEQVFEDALPSAPAPSAWADVADFDQAFKITTIDNSPVSVLTYGYDYILSKSITPPSGYLYTWTYTDLGIGQVTTCPSKRYFQQRESYVYESVAGYPMGVLSMRDIASTPNFTTTSYTLTDNDAGSMITPVSGWYPIPAGHSITIEKWVTTPELTLYSDDISNVINFPSYTPNLHDKSISWSVARHLGITLAHDAGETNIPAMPQRGMTVGDGTIIYRTSRL